jgi:hypothetical protein
LWNNLGASARHRLDFLLKPVGSKCAILVQMPAYRFEIIGRKRLLEQFTMSQRTRVGIVTESAILLRLG